MVLIVGIWFGVFGQSSQAGGAKSIEFVEVSGIIDPSVAHYLERKLDEANRDGSTALIIRLDTSASLGVSTTKIVSKIRASRVPTVVWVGPRNARARSLGFFITIASDIAVMAPGASLGPGLPLNLAAKQSDEAVMEEAAEIARSAAAIVGRNPEAAAGAVRASRSVESEDAMRSGLINMVSTLPTLLDDLHNEGTAKSGGEPLRTRGVAVRFHSMGVWERILHTSASPEVAYFLVLLGFFGLIFEIYHPGIGAAGLLGGGAIALGTYGLSILPTEWIAAAAIVAAIGLYALDLQRGDFGLRTAMGTAALIAGSLLLFRGAPAEIRLSPWAVAAAVPLSLLFFISVMSAAIRARLSRPGPGAGELIGTLGLARTDIAPEGEVEAGGELWRARTASAAIPQGTAVKIQSVLGLLLIVEQVESGNGRAS